MMATCGVTSSMVVAWEEDARATPKEAGHLVPSVTVTRTKRMMSRAWLSVQKTFNVVGLYKLKSVDSEI
jgi:hypothetical protein